MGHNLADLTKEQQDDAARQRIEALEQHKAKLLTDAEATKLYERLLAGRAVHKEEWNHWAWAQVAEIESPVLEILVRAKLVAFQDSIG